MTRFFTSAAIALSMSLPVFAQDFSVDKDDIEISEKQYSPYLHTSYPDRVFWATPICTPVFQLMPG